MSTTLSAASAGALKISKKLQLDSRMTAFGKENMRHMGNNKAEEYS